MGEASCQSFINEMEVNLVWKWCNTMFTLYLQLLLKKIKKVKKIKNKFQVTTMVS